MLVWTIFTGCSYSAYYLQTGTEIQKQTDPEKIKIYFGDISQDYEIIGSIAADVFGNTYFLEKYLKKKAASIGADAVIKVNLTKISSITSRNGISGIAVKLK